MKNYRSVSLNRIKDFETYAEKKLKAGHIIIEIRLNEERNEIRSGEHLAMEYLLSNPGCDKLLPDIVGEVG